MALDETAGGLPADQTQIKATMPKTGGLTLAGQKGVSLNPADSSDIRDRLMQMITQREEASSGWGPIMERAAVSAGGPGTFAQNLQSYGTNQRNREKELFDMRVGLAQLNTEEQRVKQAQEQAAQNQLNFTNVMRAEQGLPPLPSAPQAGMAPAPQGGMAPAPQGGMAPAPQGGMAPAPQGGMAPAPQARPSNISQTQMAMLQQMYADPSTRAEAQKQFLALTKKDDIERRMESAGIVRGSPTWNQMLALNVAGASSFIPHDVRGVGGTGQQTPFGTVGAALGNPPAPAQNAVPAPVAAAPAMAPQAAPAPAPAMAPQAAPAPAMAPQAAPAPAQRSPFAPGSKEDLAWQTAQAQAKIDVEKDRQTETNKQAIAVASKASEELQTSADSADNNIIVANRISQNVQKVPELVNLLGKDTVQSAILNLADLGLRTPMGSIGINDVNQLAVQLDPSIRNIKDPKVKEARMSAAQQLARDFAYLSLQGSKMIQGQGAVSDNERALIKQATGDPSRLTAQNIVLVSRAVKYEAMNAKERRDLWNKMESNGMTFQQFRKSPEMMALKKGQYERMSKVLGLSNAPAFDPALERS
jgi:hypothetical protein